MAITQIISILYNMWCLLSKLRANQSLSARQSGDSQALAVCGEELRRLALKTAAASIL